jgi:hypothetical protein
MDRTGEGKLTDTLSFLLNSDQGSDDLKKNKESKSTWESKAFDTMKGDKWLVLKVPQDNRSHVMCDFCDGDEMDEMEWLEGPFSQSLTVRELIEYQRGSNRERRRACTDNLLRKAHWRGPREVVLIEPDKISSSSSSRGKEASSAITMTGGIEDERNLSSGTRSGKSTENVENFRRRVAPYRGVDLFESERKRRKGASNVRSDVGGETNLAG